MAWGISGTPYDAEKFASYTIFKKAHGKKRKILEIYLRAALLLLKGRYQKVLTTK